MNAIQLCPRVTLRPDSKGEATIAPFNELKYRNHLATHKSKRNHHLPICQFSQQTEIRERQLWTHKIGDCLRDYDAVNH
jgi:hypothetical protein